MEVHMFKRILLPTDGSDTATRAAQVGLTLAEEEHAEAVLLTVVPPFHTLTLFPDSLEESRASYPEASQRTAHQRLAPLETLASQRGIAAESQIVEADDTCRAILDTARERDCDLIVMCSHRHGGLHALLGSETQKVLTQSHIPVLVFH
jgi:nucleotide-binding universal stress UspA family protein